MLFSVPDLPIQINVHLFKESTQFRENYRLKGNGLRASVTSQGGLLDSWNGDTNAKQFSKTPK